MLNIKNKVLLSILLFLTSLLVILLGDINTPLDVPETLVKSTSDPRSKILADYLDYKKSPLKNSSEDFIEAADHYGIDWKLVPAISGVESTFGKNSYGYNAWGWGIYGDQALGFRSWRSGIFTVTEGLRKNYVDRGLTNPYSMNRAYAASKSWGGRVAYFMDDIDDFASEYETFRIEHSKPHDRSASAKASY